jgi:hypothetical protein
MRGPLGEAYRMTDDGFSLVGVVIHGDECAALRRIIDQWIGEGFSVEGPDVDLAYRLLDRLSIEEQPSS